MFLSHKCILKHVPQKIAPLSILYTAQKIYQSKLYLRSRNLSAKAALVVYTRRRLHFSGTRWPNKMRCVFIFALGIYKKLMLSGPTQQFVPALMSGGDTLRAVHCDLPHRPRTSHPTIVSGYPLIEYLKPTDV